MANLRTGRLYYGWLVVAITFVALLIAAGVRSSPGVLIRPIELEFGWSRDAISFAVSIGLVFHGLSGPFAGRLMDSVGPRRVMLLGLALTGISTAASIAMQQLWQLDLLWGLLSGVGTGATSAVLGATVANRWFATRRGFVVGLFGAAVSAGQLVFVPLLMWLVVAVGWRGGTIMLSAAALLALVPVYLLMRDDPAQLGLRPYGAQGPLAKAAPAANMGLLMRRAVRIPEFWLLAASFGVCGVTSSGLIGVHLIPHSVEHGFSEMTAAGALAVMGTMNFCGTIASGWLTDRYDPRKLLACYYSFRGLALFFLPFAGDAAGLTVFAVVFGLDFIATVPPTATLVADIFGRRNAGTIFGWIFFSHQLGAALAAYLGGVARVALGDYQLAFLAGGALAIIAGMLALRIDRAPRAALEASR